MHTMHLLHSSKAAVHKAASVAARLVKVASRKRTLLWPVWQTLPVAGLDGPTAQAVLYSLRQALVAPPGSSSSEVSLPASSTRS